MQAILAKETITSIKTAVEVGSIAAVSGFLVGASTATLMCMAVEITYAVASTRIEKATSLSSSSTFLQTAKRVGIITTVTFFSIKALRALYGIHFSVVKCMHAHFFHHLIIKDAYCCLKRKSARVEAFKNPSLLESTALSFLPVAVAIYEGFSLALLPTIGFALGIALGSYFINRSLGILKNRFSNTLTGHLLLLSLKVACLTFLIFSVGRFLFSYVPFSLACKGALLMEGWVFSRVQHSSAANNPVKKLSALSSIPPRHLEKMSRLQKFLHEIRPAFDHLLPKTLHNRDCCLQALDIATESKIVGDKLIFNNPYPIEAVKVVLEALQELLSPTSPTKQSPPTTDLSDTTFTSSTFKNFLFSPAKSPLFKEKSSTESIKIALDERSYNKQALESIITRLKEVVKSSFEWNKFALGLPALCPEA